MNMAAGLKVLKVMMRWVKWNSASKSSLESDDGVVIVVW